VWLAFSIKQIGSVVCWFGAERSRADYRLVCRSRWRVRLSWSHPGPLPLLRSRMRTTHPTFSRCACLPVCPRSHADCEFFLQSTYSGIYGGRCPQTSRLRVPHFAFFVFPHTREDVASSRLRTLLSLTVQKYMHVHEPPRKAGMYCTCNCTVEDNSGRA
jgi:hypothetical protein